MHAAVSLAADPRMRDSRAMNRIDPALRPVHARLMRWGRWTAPGGHGGGPQGCPSNTLLARIIEGGVAWATTKGHPPSGEMPRHIKAIQTAVESLEGSERLVIREYYLTSRPTEAMLVELRMPLRMFYAALNQGRCEVRGHLRASGNWCN